MDGEMGGWMDGEMGTRIDECTIHDGSTTVQMNRE